MDVGDTQVELDTVARRQIDRAHVTVVQQALCLLTVATDAEQSEARLLDAVQLGDVLFGKPFFERAPERLALGRVVFQRPQLDVQVERLLLRKALRSQRPAHAILRTPTIDAAKREKDLLVGWNASFCEGRQ